VNGLPATGDSVSGPANLSGAFSNGLALVSQSQKACYEVFAGTGQAGQYEENPPSFSLPAWIASEEGQTTA